MTLLIILNIGALPTARIATLGGRNSLVRCPAFIQALINHPRREAELFRSLDYGHLCASEQVDGVGPFVAGLHLRGRPPAIFGRIGSVIVDAVKAVFGPRPHSHVRKKIFKAIIPPLANCDAPPPIIGPITSACGFTAPAHFRPALVSRRIGKAMPSVSVAGLLASLNAQATAASRHSPTQRRAKNFSLYAAITSAKRTVPSASNYRPSSETCSNWVRVKSHLLTISHGNMFSSREYVL